MTHWADMTDAERDAHHAAYAALTPAERKARLDAMMARITGKPVAAPASLAPAPTAPVIVERPAAMPAQKFTTEEVNALYEARQREWAREQVIGDPAARAWIESGGSVTPADIEAANLLIAALAMTDDEIAGVPAEDRAAADLLIAAARGFPDKPAAGRAKPQPAAPATPMTAEEREFQRVFGPALDENKRRRARGI